MTGNRLKAQLGSALRRDTPAFTDLVAPKLDVEAILEDIEGYGGLCSAAQDDANRGIDPAPTRAAAAELLAEIADKLRTGRGDQ